MSSILALGQTRNLGSRSNSGGREEVAGGGVGEVLEERGEGAQPRHRPSLEVVPHWVRQAGLVYNCSIISCLSKVTITGLMPIIEMFFPWIFLQIFLLKIEFLKVHFYTDLSSLYQNIFHLTRPWQFSSYLSAIRLKPDSWPLPICFRKFQKLNNFYVISFQNELTLNFIDKCKCSIHPYP